MQFQGNAYVKLTNGKLLPKEFAGFHEHITGGKAPQSWMDKLALTAPESFTDSQAAKECYSKYWK